LDGLMMLNPDTVYRRASPYILRIDMAWQQQEVVEDSRNVLVDKNRTWNGHT
jgi:hypothetical protein